MRKSIVVIVLLGFIAGSCATYSCPTYAKKPNKIEKKDLVQKDQI